jgi:hypothetical protein
MKVHRLGRLSSVVVVLATLGMSVVFAPCAGAGVQSANILWITKIVVGDVPADAEFTVRVVCTATVGDAPPIVTEVVFDAAGTAISGNAMLNVGDLHECTATETVTGGATLVTFATVSLSVGLEHHATQTSGTVKFFDMPEVDAATIAVTNYFPARRDTEPASAVLGPPAFTG